MMTCGIMLPSGVMMAEMMKKISMAYLKFRSRNRAVTMPKRASTNISIGSWNTTPMASSSLTYKLPDRLDARGEREELVGEAGEEIPRERETGGSARTPRR